jgi:hypothetical protein
MHSMGMHCLGLPGMGVHQCIKHNFSLAEIRFNICMPIQGKGPFFLLHVSSCVGVFVCWWLCKLTDVARTKSKKCLKKLNSWCHFLTPVNFHAILTTFYLHIWTKFLVDFITISAPKRGSVHRNTLLCEQESICVQYHETLLLKIGIGGYIYLSVWGFLTFRVLQMIQWIHCRIRWSYRNTICFFY